MSDTSERMQDAARAVESILPPGTGFVLLAFDFETSTGRIDYVSNAQRDGVILAMREFLAKNESPQFFGKHLESEPPPPS